MSNQTITIDVTPAGSVKIEAEGFEGCGCTDATQQLEVVLGGVGRNKKTDYKPEFTAPASTNATVKQTF